MVKSKKSLNNLNLGRDSIRYPQNMNKKWQSLPSIVKRLKYGGYNVLTM